MGTKKPRYTARKFPKIRKATIELLKAAKRKNMIHSVLEVDISRARRNLKNFKKDSKQFISFTGYIIYCVSKAVESDKKMHAYRNRKKQLVLFDDVDVSTTVERNIDGNSEVVAMIIRGANKKSIAEISEEIRKEKSQTAEQVAVYKSINLFLAIPPMLRQMVFRILDKSPFLMKKRAGTVMITSAQIAGRGAIWGIPIATHTLNVTIGSIVNRVVEINREFESREHLCLTISVDHDIIDGAPAARFIRRLIRIIESGQIAFE